MNGAKGNGEGHRTYLVLRRRRRWWCCILCFTGSSASVRLSSLSLFLLSSSSGFYKPKNGLWCNVQLGNGM
ncbi:hypothetical protein POPTR_006G101150v4 [Populus trichocarpa]|uniref:Uncharacterized protein n=1 Tax=Populus trichocarpa TaxID=3694 RepID=A0ACC0STC9_POPTR|nr:hypothetical protein POPTR_006G101150v4 [Populus trichocarpa]